jgi:hypothetical protein
MGPQIREVGRTSKNAITYDEGWGAAQPKLTSQFDWIGTAEVEFRATARCGSIVFPGDLEVQRWQSLKEGVESPLVSRGHPDMRGQCGPFGESGLRNTLPSGASDASAAALIPRRTSSLAAAAATAAATRSSRRWRSESTDWSSAIRLRVHIRRFRRDVVAGHSGESNPCQGEKRRNSHRTTPFGRTSPKGPRWAADALSVPWLSDDTSTGMDGPL